MSLNRMMIIRSTLDPTIITPNDNDNSKGSKITKKRISNTSNELFYLKANQSEYEVIKTNADILPRAPFRCESQDQ